MKNLISKVALFGLATSLLAFVGCAQEGLPPGQSPEDVITAALLHQGDITQSVYEITGSADLAGDVDGEQNSLKGNARMAGSTNTDEGTMLMTLTFDADMKNKMELPYEERQELIEIYSEKANAEIITTEDSVFVEITESIKADIEIRANEDGVFVKIGSVEVSDAESQKKINEKMEKYLGNWVELTFMTSEDLVESGYAEVDYSEGDPLPFKNIEYIGITDILGLKSYHFTADVDEQLILNMMGDASIADAEEFFEAATIKGDVYVAVDEMVISGFGGNVNLNDPEMNGTVELQIKVNPTRSDSVATPTTDLEFTEEDMSALLFGGMMAPPGAGSFDKSMFEEEGEMTDEEFAEMMKGFEDFDMPTPEETSPDNPMFYN